MLSFKPLAIAASALALSLPFMNASPANAQVSISIGAAPVCPYGYYDFAPYNCAPYGYYGPEWFRGGVFIGAGPWYHGDHDWHGAVDNRYDPRHGYHGPFPEHNDQRFNHFHGNEFRDGRGHEFHGDDHGDHGDHHDHH